MEPGDRAVLRETQADEVPALTQLVGARGNHQQTNKQSFQLVLDDTGQSGAEGQGYRRCKGLSGEVTWGWRSAKVRGKSVLSLRNSKCKGPEVAVPGVTKEK